MTTAATDNGHVTYPIRAVDRVCDILDTLANASGGVSLSEIADTTDLPKSSAFRYLTALEARHYVERSAGAGAYSLGLAFRARDTRGVERLSELARPVLERLRDQLQETVNMGVLDGTHVVHTVVAESPHMMRLAARVGERGYVHSTALGKAMCAELPEERVRSILEVAGMPPFTAATLTDPDGYVAELERTRAAGFGIDEAENQAAGRCLAVTVEGVPLLAGISISAPIDRLPMERVPDVVRQLHRAARTMSRHMQA